MRDTKQEINRFWFEETLPQQWFQKNDNFDALVRERFAVTYEMACDGLCNHWNRDVDGCLALVLLLDQFPRRMFYNTAKAYETDSKALLMAKYAVKKGFDQCLDVAKRRFLYLPFKHSETVEDQERSVALFEMIKEDDPVSYEYAKRHLAIIKAFGRFPQRNETLDRETTKEEEHYLEQPVSIRTAFMEGISGLSGYVRDY